MVPYFEFLTATQLGAEWETPKSLESGDSQTLKGFYKSDPLEPYGKLYKDYIRVRPGLYRGSKY